MLADAQEPSRAARADQPCVQLRRRGTGSVVDILDAKAVMAAGRGFSRLERPPRSGAKNSRLADAKA
jgi:hypothetical protein